MSAGFPAVRPRRLRGKLLSKRHRITVSFGEPIPPNGGDTAALIEALQKKHLAGAALDVFEIEPLPPGHPLTQL